MPDMLQPSDRAALASHEKKMHLVRDHVTAESLVSMTAKASPEENAPGPRSRYGRGQGIQDGVLPVRNRRLWQVFHRPAAPRKFRCALSVVQLAHDRQGLVPDLS